MLLLFCLSASFCVVVLRLRVTVQFFLFNRPHQEAALLLECKFLRLRVNVPFAGRWKAVSLYSLNELPVTLGPASPLFVWSLISPGYSCVCVCVCGCFELWCCTFWPLKWNRPSCCRSGGFFSSSDRKEGTGRAWRQLLLTAMMMMCWCSAELSRSSPLSLISQRSASGFPSVFPKLHWFWPLYLGGPGPLALAVTLCWQKNTESWQRCCSQKHKAWSFCRQSVLFLGYCFVTVWRGKLF